MGNGNAVASAARKVRWALVALLVAPLVVLASPAPAGAIGQAADTGAVVTAEQWIVNDRVLDLTVQSPSTDNATRKVRLILPAGWSKDADRTWPSLYMLHGGVDDYTAWDAKSNLRTLSQGEDAIMVLPDTSWCSAYSNWWNNGSYGRPQWETWIMTEVVQILERNYRAGTTRGIVGNSMGGLGAMKFAAKYNEMFSVAASFSGDLDTLRSWPGASGVSTPGLGCNPFGDYWKRVWGDPAIPAQREMWVANNPYDQAHLLDGLSLYLGAATGSGDNIPRAATQHMAAKLDQLGIPVTTNYTSGGHDWTQWTSQLTTAWPQLMAGLEEPPVNTAPTADAGPDQTVPSGATVTLDGIGSDADDDELTFTWEQTDGPTVALSDATAADPSFTAPTGPASLTFSLTVSDGTATSTDTVTILVEEPDTVNVVGSVSAVVSPVGAQVYAFPVGAAWPVAGAPVTGDGPSSGVFGFDALADGDYQFLVVPTAESRLLRRWVGGDQDRGGAATFSVSSSVVTLPLVEPVGGGAVSGSVTDGGGAPVVGAKVGLYGAGDVWLPTVEVTTGADGSFVTQAVVDGTYQVRVVPTVASGLAPQWYDGATGRGAAVPVVVTAPDVTAGVDVVVAGAGTISGTVTGPGGAPVADVWVMAYTATDTWVGSEWAYTGADGTYSFVGVPQGTYRVRFGPPTGSGLAAEWYDNTTSRAAAAPLVVGPGSGHTGIDATLATG